MITAGATLNVAICLLVAWIASVQGEDQQREVAIIKQINRVNEDGTYTFGYEAADGSFKIETRDVMGNVKGMFGFVDDQGELKRVSYTASNGTGFQATTGNANGQGVTRKPVLIFRHPPGVIPTPVTRSSVIQHIPRRTTTARPDHTSVSEPQASSTEGPRPVRILVTKRPIGGDERIGHDLRRQLTPVDSPNLATHLKQLALNSQQTVREQLRRQQLIGADHLRQAAETKRQVDSEEDDSPDVYGGGIGGGHRLYPHRALRIQQAPITQQDPREVYRNMLLEQSGLKPDLPQRRYYPRQPPQVEDEYDEPLPAMVPVANRVLPAMLRGRIDDGYQADGYISRPGYSRFARQRYSGNNYGGIDYEALRDELMQYLIQYLEYRVGRNPYYGRQLAYQPQQNYRYQQPNYDNYQDRYYRPQQPYQRGYNQGYNNGYPGYPAPIPPPYSGNVPIPNAVHLPPNGQYPGFSPNVQYTGNIGNVQYSNSQDSNGATVTIPVETPKQENRVKISTLKQRMAEIGDANDNYHTQPMPSSSLIHMLLATPTPRRPLLAPQRLIQTQPPLPLQRPVQAPQRQHIQTIPSSQRPVTTTQRLPVRSVEIVTAATTVSSPVTGTSTTPAPVTETKDEMQAVS